MPEKNCCQMSISTRQKRPTEQITRRYKETLWNWDRSKKLQTANIGDDASEDTHALVATLATCRVRVAGVSRGRKGMMRTEEGERSLAISGLRRRLGVLTVQCQAHSLLGRLEVLGPGAAAAAGRRWQAAELERCWRKEERAHSLATAQGWRSYRTGFGKLD